MNDPYVNDEAGEVVVALGQRIDTVRELIGQLTISPAAPDDSATLAPTPENFRQICERLRRLLEQSGMVDCARAALSLEQASTGLPSEESLGAIDAVLVYIRARVRDVTLPGTTGNTHAATVAPGVTDELAAGDTGDTRAIGAADEPAQSEPV